MQFITFVIQRGIELVFLLLECLFKLSKMIFTGIELLFTIVKGGFGEGFTFNKETLIFFRELFELVLIFCNTMLPGFLLFHKLLLFKKIALFFCVEFSFAHFELLFSALQIHA